MSSYLAGPTGRGNRPFRTLLAEKYGICHYVNADAIARGLSAFQYDSMAVKAAQVMLVHLRELAEERANFAFETTLGTKSFAPWIAELKKAGYVFHLIYVWVRSPEVSIQRVKDRVMVASSKMMIGGFLRKTRAMLSRCFCPPESFTPRCPMSVS